MKYKAIEAPEPDEASPGCPFFDRDMPAQLSLEGTHSHLLKQVKRPFVLRLFRGRQLDQRLIHSDQDISETMRKICQEDIDAFEIEEVIAEGPTPTPQYAEFFTEEDGKMHLTPIMELFSLLDYLKNKSAENSEEQDGEPIDQETLAAIIADDVAREKIRIRVPEPMRESTDLMRAFDFSSTSAEPLTAQAGPAACVASSSGTSPMANEETAKDSCTVVDKAPTQELALPAPDEQSSPNQSPTEVNLSWMGESPDQNQLQRLVRFMNVLTDMITGYSCPESK
ncbi:hypothetical protein CROQUDRAFT_662654 [Cronartium quercuum f. sp. fusiforme G11]|uniref:Uncharacterized protein n=1 Tax=Cronartium quercuum f. sp. fusiforme G11 TaxID=708437 RepID=A0A9P6NE46_9BASI|nr:hypothetical protein CROQUDRAFT_662654 [Cronartium quercuum f. sp. fusiforme G11]